MRWQYFPGIIISALLIYLSIFGLAGFGLQLVGDTLKEDWDSLQTYNWQRVLGGASSCSGGLLTQATKDDGLDYNRASVQNIESNGYYALSGKSAWTCEFKTRLDQMSSDGSVAFWWYWDVTKWIVVGISPTKVTFPNGITQNLVTGNDWHVWTVVVSNGKFDLFREDQLIKGSLTIGSVSSSQKRITIDVSGAGSRVSHDYYYIDNGAKIPGTPSESQAQLTVTCAYQNSQGDWVPLEGVSVTAGGQTASTPNAIFTLTKGQIQVSVAKTFGEYTFSSWTTGGTSTTTTVDLQVDTVISARFTRPTTPGKVSLTVSCKLEGADLSGISVTAGTQTLSSPATFEFDQGSVITVSVPTTTSSGNNFVSWGDGITSNSRSVTLSSSTSLLANYIGGSQPPPGPVLPDFLQTIRNFFENAFIRQLELIAGGLGLLICGVMFILPKGGGGGGQAKTLVIG